MSADYVVFPNGTAYQAAIEINDTASYQFASIGLMGENVPVNVGNVNLSGEKCSVCTYAWNRPWGSPASITFEPGNYTVSYIAPLNNNDLQASFEVPYNVNVTIPQEFDIRNPLLAGISTGANVTRHPDNSTTVQWNKILSFDLRFYDQSHEELLYFFLQVLVIIAIVMLLPFLINRKGNE
ncbi:MAG: DUF5803 family protein [Methanoregula sp.]|uniref:DUF5803 family protein n=1 Tax=Methanoregula sp. TaxID=2052170 RepID=UPI003D0B040F